MVFEIEIEYWKHINAYFREIKMTPFYRYGIVVQYTISTSDIKVEFRHLVDSHYNLVTFYLKIFLSFIDVRNWCSINTC